MADEWDLMFADYSRALADLNGDGVPDNQTGNTDIANVYRAAGNRLRGGRAMPQGINTVNTGLIAGAADPFGIPSAVTGIVNPELRDQWRAAQNADPVGSGLGSVVSAGGIGGTVLRGVNSGAGAALRLAGLSTASDFADAGAGVPGALSSNTAAKGALAAAGGLPFRYALPTAATGAGLMQPNSAAAQGADVEALLRQHRAAGTLRAYQQQIGVTPDGEIGPNTRAAAIAYEQRQGETARRQADSAAEAARIEAQGRATAETERARIQAEADAAIRKAQADAALANEQAQKPFLQRNPDYGTYAPYIAGAASFALPLATQMLLRRAATTPQRQGAQAVDRAIRQFDAAPNALAARSVAQANAQYSAAEPVQRSMMGNVLDYGVTGTAAALPSAAALMPYVIDYNQPAGSEAKEQARKEFTLDALRERMIGPFAMGLTLAGAGTGVGGAAGRAFVNPVPAQLPRAGAINALVAANPSDDVALNQAIGISRARPPQVTFEDGGIPWSPPSGSGPQLPVGPPSGGSGPRLPTDPGNAGTRAGPSIAGPVEGPTNPPPAGGPTPSPRKSSQSRSSSALSQKDKEVVKEAFFKAWERQGDNGLSAADLTLPPRFKRYSPETINLYLNEVNKLAMATGHATGKDQVNALRQLRASGAKFSIPAAVGGGAMANALAQYYGELD